MKNLLLTIALLLGLNTFANETITISGQQGRVNTVETIISHGLRLDRKTAIFQKEYNNGYMADGSYTAITINGVKRYVQLSNKMLVNLATEINKKDSDISFREILRILCTVQGNVIMDTIDDVSGNTSGGNCGHANCRPTKYSVNLTETNSRLALLEKDHQDINGNLIIINGKIDNLAKGQQQLAANQQVIIDNQQKIIKQNKTSNTIGIINGVIGLTDLGFDIFGNKRSNTYNYRRTTNIFNTGSQGGPGHNGNSGLPAGFQTGYNSVGHN